MKIVFSRKGFDSSTGKVPSPILPSGELCSLPIPESMPESHSRQYKDIMAGNHCLGDMVNDLTGGKITPDTIAHFDPDLNLSSVPRPENWKPIFGQAGAAERHLQNNGVKAGDIFLFFGWFRQVEVVAGRYQYVSNAPDLHVLFGWLQIEQRLSVEDFSSIPLWALNHPHCKRNPYNKLDSIYISTIRIQLPHFAREKSGGGTFRKFDPALCLTAPEKSRSIWQLPTWFYPSRNKSCLTYHNNLNRWTQKEGHVLLNTVGRGQEFILNCEEYPESLDWLCSLLNWCD